MALVSAANFAMSPQGRQIINMILTELSGVITPQSVGRFLASRLPGKKNRAKRNAIKKQVLGSSPTQSAPVAYNVPIKKVAPRFRSAQGKYVVCNREFLTEVTGATNFGLTELTTQPGLATSFPWLSQIANTHQRYHIKSLKFTYVPLAATSERGRVVLAFAIDPLDPAPASKAELFQYPTSTESSVWASNTLVVDPMSRNTTLFTRAGAVADTDIKTYDFGKLFIGASNTANDTDKIGEVFIDYEVELSVPKPAKCPASLTEISVPNISTLFDGPNNQMVFVGSNVIGEHDGANDEHIRFLAPGTYLVTLTISATSTGSFTMSTAELDGTAAIISTAASAAKHTTILKATVISNSRIGLNYASWTGVTKCEVTVSSFTADVNIAVSPST